jgi:hypothetical protein
MFAENIFIPVGSLNPSARQLLIFFPINNYLGTIERATAGMITRPGYYYGIITLRSNVIPVFISISILRIGQTFFITNQLRVKLKSRLSFPSFIF